MVEAAPHDPAQVDVPSAGVAATAESPPEDSPSFFGHVIVVALASGLFALVWFIVYTALDSLVWDGDVVESSWWAPPLIIMGSRCRWGWPYATCTLPRAWTAHSSTR